MARESQTRTYHSTALLLPNGRVLVVGGATGMGAATAELVKDASGEVLELREHQEGALAALERLAARKFVGTSRSRARRRKISRARFSAS